ncbi:unnamed protein product [Clonostachys byssicola]|uniref:Uncharacterized protein n=1 Tax=Clonostachys byssicola TaxID=160290 RepID=A0A9N9UGF3_9HYPO|nr:unnamed protein product [Clonostachys byssicola]
MRKGGGQSLSKGLSGLHKYHEAAPNYLPSNLSSSFIAKAEISSIFYRFCIHSFDTMDARSMDDQDQIRDTQRQRELKIEALRLEIFKKKSLMQRLSVVDSALEACDDNLPLDGMKEAVESALFGHIETSQRDRPPCPVCGPGKCQHLESLDPMFVGIVLNAFCKLHFLGGVMSQEAWLRLFAAEIFAKKDIIQDELSAITQQLERLEKERCEEEQK